VVKSPLHFHDETEKSSTIIDTAIISSMGTPFTGGQNGRSRDIRDGGFKGFGLQTKSFLHFSHFVLTAAI
jgi:hypothetical protein